MQPRRWRTAIWFGALAALALAAWLFLPRDGAGRRTAPRLRAVLVDASASVARARNWLPWVRAELRARAAEAAAAGEEFCVASFADGLVTDFAPGAPARFLALLEGRQGAPLELTAGLAPGATRLADALEGIEPWLLARERPPAELALLGPAEYTGPSPAANLARLRSAGVTFTTRAPPPAEESDLGVYELVLPPRLEPGAPVVALARLVLRRGTAPLGTARLVLALEREGGVRQQILELALPGVDGEFELPVDCGPAGPGRNELRAWVEWAAGPDLVPENDVARASAFAPGVRVLGVAVAPELRAEAEAWLAPGGRTLVPGLQAVFLEPGELAGRLAELDALVTFDLAPRDLPAPLVESFVRRGGGWLALAGWRFLGGWIPGADGALERLLPCEPAGGEAPPREVVVLVDGSGSMEGAPFDSVRAAALELVAAALPSDRVSLRFFTRELEPEHLLKERSPPETASADGAREAARELLGVRVPSGTTFLLRSLREFRATVGASETLLLLLTDGQDREAGAGESAARSVAAELASARVRLVVIGVGDVNAVLLAALAGGAERVRAGDSLADLRAIFQRELHAERLAEGELELRLAARARGSLADEVVSAAGASATPAPIERYVRGRLRGGGESLWESREGEPVLSLARAALGRTALFASRPGSDWASRHARCTEDGLGGVLRWLARGPERASAPRARLEGERLRVTALAPETPAELGAELLGGDGARVLGELTLLPPAELGLDVLRTREAPVASPWRGDAAPLLRLAGGAEAGTVLAVELALADEFAWREHEVPAVWLRSEDVASAGAAPGAGLAALTALGVGLALLFAAGTASARGSRSS